MRRGFLRTPDMTRDLPGGGSRVTLRVSCLDEVRCWVLDWEEHATVIGPEQLIRSLEKAGWVRTMEERKPMADC